jgi:hypothetical protein
MRALTWYDPGVGLPGVVSRTGLPDRAAGLRADGQTREAPGSNLTVGGAGEEHLTIDLQKSASRATDVTADELGRRT